MLLRDCININLDKRFLADEEAALAIREFFKKIPGRVLELNLDTSISTKQGITRGEELFKFGYSTENGVVFVEYFENRNQGLPTMSIYIENRTPKIFINGAKAATQFRLKLTIENDVVVKNSELLR